MVRAQCYYEILGIEETATSDEIKKAYRNLALIWHPDKNQQDPQQAHAKFQSILKAYETLSDSKERDWYDRHKDQILSDGDKDANDVDCLNLFQYFSSSCYANFDDSKDGFYTIYREVFNTISEEELKACRQSKKLSKSKQQSRSNEEPDYPSFGHSNSDYDETVRPFYAFWSGFSTNLTFDQLDKYNTTEAENRRILRLMEKENKKLKEQARKDRNTNVRNLVEFIKKRDKRLKAHKALVEEQNKLNREKTAEKQRMQRQRVQKQLQDYKPTAWDDMDEIEQQLRLLESEYDLKEANGRRKNRRYENDTSDEDDIDVQDSFHEETNQEAHDPIENEQLGDEEDEDEDEPDFYCPACSKDFKSIKAFENHEASKKHKQNVVKLKKLLEEEERRAK